MVIITETRFDPARALDATGRWFGELEVWMRHCRDRYFAASKPNGPIDAATARYLAPVYSDQPSRAYIRCRTRSRLRIGQTSLQETQTR